jgi:hypothetical protein
MTDWPSLQPCGPSTPIRIKEGVRERRGAILDEKRRVDAHLLSTKSKDCGDGDGGRTHIAEWFLRLKLNSVSSLKAHISFKHRALDVIILYFVIIRQAAPSCDRHPLSSPFWRNENRIKSLYYIPSLLEPAVRAVARRGTETIFALDQALSLYTRARKLTCRQTDFSYRRTGLIFSVVTHNSAKYKK